MSNKSKSNHKFPGWGVSSSLTMKCLLPVSTLHTNFCGVILRKSAKAVLLFTATERGIMGIQFCSSVEASHFKIENRKRCPFTSICLIDTPHLDAVYLLKVTVDPFITSPSFAASHPCWRHQVSLYTLNHAVTFILFEAGDKSCTEVEWLKMLLSDKLFLTKHLFGWNFNIFLIHYILIQPILSSVSA